VSVQDGKNIRITELKDSLQSSNDRYSEVRVIAEYILIDLKSFESIKSKSTKEIFKKYENLKKDYPEVIPDIPRATFAVFLSINARDQLSRINCLGKKQGYFLEELVSEIAEIEELKNEESKELSEKEIVYEKDIYPFIKEWLFEKNHDRVADISMLKKNGKWGNPDLIGLNIEEMFGHLEIEITTVEVKTTDDGWDRWIFEAVAHTRFSNRSYFAFIYPEDLINKLDSTGLNLYAEHFNIGILIIAVNRETYLNIKKKEPITFDEESVSIVEYRHAPFNETHIKFRKKFLESLDVLEIGKLYEFGDKLS